MNIKEYLKTKKILCDGAFGTYYASFNQDSHLPEKANIKNPRLVKQIHKEYIEAGAKLIRTNTFAANTQTLSCTEEELRENIRSSVRLVREAAEECGREIFIAGDIGPLAADSGEYELICETFLTEGVDCLVFETLSEYETILDMVKKLKKQQDIFIILQFSVNQLGFTAAGISARRLAEEVGRIEEVDALGFNCGVGPGHLAQIMGSITLPEHKYITALPNAGYPSMQQDRMVFAENREYFAEKVCEIAAMGVDFIGGCCGTTPAYIARTAEKVNRRQKEKKTQEKREIAAHIVRKKDSSFYAGRARGEKLIAVELAPPFHADDEKIMEASHYLKRHGIDAATFPDSPSGRTRADSIMVGIKAAQTSGICAMPHICCRDKNAIAIRAQILGAYMNGIRNLLVITGDPVPGMMRKDIKSVYNFDSVGMMKILQEMNEEEFADDPIVYGGAINHNCLNQEVELERIQKKESAGAEFFLTQPLFTKEEALRLEKLRTGTGAKVLCGIMPLVSRKNAAFIQNEMTGIRVTEELVERYRPDMSREEGEQVGISIAKEIMEMTKDFVDGYYFSIPFNRVYLLDSILQK